MATVAEVVEARPGEIPQVTVPFFNLSGLPLKRMWSGDSLNDGYLQKELGPNALFSMDIGDHDNSAEWRFIAPAGGYTPQGMHFMAMRWVPEYHPGFERIPINEGSAVTFFNGNLASAVREDPNTRIIVYGGNWSARSFGQSGFQSIPTKVHPFLFSFPDFSEPITRSRFIKLVDEKVLDTGAKLAVAGTRYNEQVGQLLLNALQKGETADSAVLQDLLDINKAKIDYRGLRIPTKKPIDDILRSKGVFTGLIHPVSVYMRTLATNLSVAFTDLDPIEVDQKIAETFVKNYPSDEARIKDGEEILGQLSKIPSLLSRKERFRSIASLASIYPPEFIDYLIKVSLKLPDSGPAEGWKIGGAHMLAFHYDQKLDEGFFAVFATMVNGPGGIVEGTQGMLLQRPPNPYSRDEVFSRVAAYKSCIELAFDKHNGYHELARLKQVFI